MRGLKKPRSPRNVSPDGQMRRSMQQAEKDFLAALPSEANKAICARSTFDALEKRRLREVLYAEQGSLCVFCERRIAEEQHPPPRIDHWRPLGANPDLALCWRNLYLCCATETTCDCRKQESPLRANDQDSDLPWPVDHAYEHSVGFTSLGEMYVRSDAPLSTAQRAVLALAIGAPHNGEKKNNGILNLNLPTLVAARQAALDSERDRLEHDYRGKTAGKADRAARAEAMLAKRPLLEYVSIRVCWLTRTLGEGR
jgi:uncharacterized protein (TIGR02646 family)